VNYWLIKTEPGTWSWDDQLAAPRKTTEWDGVKNHQANNNLKAMKKGDRCFFYHSVNDKCIVGIVEVAKAWVPDPAQPDTPWGYPCVKAVEELPTPVTLADVKQHPKLDAMVLVKNSRLSVQPVTANEWKLVCKMGGLS
jgi:predicted RNA-binding protein with PUA-like domain